MNKLFGICTVSLLVLAGCDWNPTGPERRTVRVVVPGQSNIVFLPLMISAERGYFEEEGLEVEIQNAASGAQARQMLLDGTADVVVGFYDHTIQLQAEGRDVLGVALIANRPGVVLAVRADLADQIQQVSDLRGRRVGVSSPGAGTHTFLRYLLSQAGVAEAEVTVVGIGLGSSAVQAVEAREVEALANLDPAITLLSRRGAIQLLRDTRTQAGTHAVYGGDYPATAAYTQRDFIDRYPRTTQRLVNGLVKGLRWMSGATPAQIVDALPATLIGEDRDLYIEMLTSSAGIYSPDGRFSQPALQNVLNVLRQFDEEVAGAQVDITRTYTNRFVDRARP